jgi:putative transposase
MKQSKRMSEKGYQVIIERGSLEWEGWCMEGKRYPSDLTDDEWVILESLIPSAKPGGPPRSADLREVVNGIFYVLRGGIPWRFLPKEFPPWKTVYHYFRLCRLDG